MREDHVELPIKIDATSNGEFFPMPVGGMVSQARALAAARITDNARRLNVSRRAFLTGLCGTATTLLTLNHTFAARGNTGGYFQVHPEAAFDLAAAQESLMGGGKRLLLHAMVLPNLSPPEAQLEAMARVVEEWQIAAWKSIHNGGPTAWGGP
jgi:hypothetical protein